MEKETTTIKISAKIHKELKIYVAETGERMQDVTDTALAAFFEKNRKTKKK